MTTLAPASESASAAASPMPRPPPVTTALRARRLKRCIYMRSSGSLSGREPGPRLRRRYPPEQRDPWSALSRHRALELAQHLVAAADGGVERRLSRLLAVERLLDFLGPDIAQLHHVAEAQTARVLRRLLVRELEDRRLQIGRLLIEPLLLGPGISCLGDR